MSETSAKDRVFDILNQFGPVLALLAVYGIFAAMVPMGWMPESFISVGNLQTMARQYSPIAIAALGATLIIIAGGIDLSVGSVIALCSVLVAAAMKDLGWPPALAALAGIVGGIACGLLNGSLIVGLRMVPFIITLGTMMLLRGLAKGIAKNNTVVPDESNWLDLLLASSTQKTMLLAPGVWLMLGLALITALMLRYTRFGRHVFAIGSNEETARLCGVPVWRVKLMVYALAGFFAGVAGLLQYSRLNLGDPTTATGKELDVIAAVVIGGGSLSGGAGSVVGTLAGAMIMAIISSAATSLGLPTWVQEMLTGAIIVTAVALDRLRHRRTA